MTDVSDLVEFLKACIDEDEAVAQAAGADSETWEFRESLPRAAIATGHGWESTLGSGVWDCDDPYDDCEELRGEARAEAAHITRWDPARVLAEVAAKRAILDQYEHGDWIVLQHVLRALAQPYAGRPGFDPTWTE